MSIRKSLQPLHSHQSESILIITQTKNQHLVLLHCLVSLPWPLRRVVRYLENQVAMGVLDHHDPLGRRPDPSSSLHG